MRIEWNSLQKRMIYNKGEMELERPVSESQYFLHETFCWLWTVLSFFHVSVSIIKEFLRPVSESQFLLQKIVCLDRFLFTLVRKMVSDEDELPSDSFAERYRHWDLLYAKK